MMSTKRYKDPVKRSEYIRRNRERYYRGAKEAENRRQPWTTHELKLVMQQNMTDRDLSAKIGRSIEAIQLMRSREKKRGWCRMKKAVDVKDVFTRCTECYELMTVCTRMCDSCKYSCMAAEVIAAMKETLKFAWHDLRKNPDDFPKEDEEVILLIDLPPTEIAKQQYIAWRRYGEWETISGLIPRGMAKAWRRLEPFEESAE